jgi:hypothetical protein
MSILPTLIFTLLFIFIASSFNLQRLENDNMCKLTSGILCVKDELMIIATVAKSIAHTSSEIEKYVNIEFIFEKNYFSFSEFRLNKQKFLKHSIDILIPK